MNIEFLNTLLSSARVLPTSLVRVLPPIVCADGCSLSVQASEFHHCLPRNLTGPYTHVEVGFPSSPVPNSWIEYADSGEIDSDVFAYVPIKLVVDFINSHGGV